MHGCSYRGVNKPRLGLETINLRLARTLTCRSQSVGVGGGKTIRRKGNSAANLNCNTLRFVVGFDTQPLENSVPEIGFQLLLASDFLTKQRIFSVARSVFPMVGRRIFLQVSCTDEA
jgi:hypothetical protein